MTTTPAPVPADLWAVPSLLDSVQPPLTDAIVAAAEAELGVKLPASYLACLRTQNGGYLRRKDPELSSQLIAGIGAAFPSITGDLGWWRPKRAKPGKWAPERPELLIPFDSEGHWDLCFDYRACGPDGEPSITHVEMDTKREAPHAASFDAYLARLTEAVGEEHHTIRLRVDVDAEHVARTIARALERAEPTVDVFANGYPTWHFRLDDGDDSHPLRPIPGASCWCSPNRVPAGFRREGNEVMATTETALRYPEDPDCTVLVECTAHQARVEEVLRAAGRLSR